MKFLRLYDDALYIIDVSQSVESDHPQALDFLKRDCVNAFALFGWFRCFAEVNNFFGKRMLSRPLPVKRLFDYVSALVAVSLAVTSLRWLRVNCRGGTR